MTCSATRPGLVMVDDLGRQLGCLLHGLAITCGLLAAALLTLIGLIAAGVI